MLEGETNYFMDEACVAQAKKLGCEWRYEKGGVKGTTIVFDVAAAFDLMVLFTQTLKEKAIHVLSSKALAR